MAVQRLAANLRVLVQCQQSALAVQLRQRLPGSRAARHNRVGVDVLPRNQRDRGGTQARGMRLTSKAWSDMVAIGGLTVEQITEWTI